MSRSTQQNTWMQDEGVKHDTYASNGNKNSNHRQGKAEELKAFVEGTSLHGARFLYDSNVFRRIFWTVILLTSLSYCIHQVFVSISAFYRRPFVTTVVVSKRTETKLGFPAVSLCNLNAFNTRRFRDLYNGSSNGPFIERYIKDISLMATKSEEILTEEFKSRNPGLFYRFQTADQTLGVKSVTSHQIAEMLLPSKSKFHSCSLNGIPCTEKNFTYHISSAYGQCYTFNSAESDKPMISATLAGQSSGLKLRLNIERDSYIGKLLNPSVGISVVIHDQKSFPFMEEFGMAIQPGISTLCAIKRKQDEKYPELNAPVPIYLFFLNFDLCEENLPLREAAFEILNRIPWPRLSRMNSQTLRIIEANKESIGIKRVRNDTHFPHNQENKKADEKSNGGLESFANDTTLHGARYLCDKNVFRRVLWTLVLIGSFSFCIYQVCETLVAFSQRPFITKVSTSKTETNESFFPAVSLCNLNYLNTRRYRNVLKSLKFSELFIEKKIQDALVIVNRDKKAFNDEFVKRNPVFFQRQKTASDIIMERSRLSHQIEEMLLPVSPQFHSCSVNGKKCTANNFTSHMSSLYGLCYTFNSLKSGRPLLYATLSGKNSGLRLLLNIERDSYLATNIRPTVGLAIIIHDQKSFPFMDDFGTTVQPGISTLCAFRKRKIVNLKAPYETNCTNRSLDMFNSDVYAYTKRACMIKCRNDYTVKRCGCTPPEFKADAPICAPNDSVLCVYNSYEEFGASSEKESCDKNCPEPCEHVEYDTSLSYSALQPESFVDHLMDFLKSNDTSVDRAIYEPLLNMTPSERERYIEKNIISLDIYFEDLSYEIIEQTPVYETWTMIGSLGGTFGLFLGMSLLTILEFLDFIFARICHLLRGLHSGNRHTGTIHAES